MQRIKRWIKPEALLLHIAKTGGTYIAQYESRRGAVIQPFRSLGHGFVTDPGGRTPDKFPPIGFESHRLTERQKIKRSHVIACVRNPYAWLVSYAGHAGGWNPRYHDPLHYDFKIANRIFDYLVKSIFNREDVWPSRRFLFMQLFSTGGRIVPCFIARNETLSQDLFDFTRRYKLSYHPGPHQRNGGHGDYRSYYTDELIELVQRHWSRELELFGYGFEGFSIRDPIMPRHIDRVTASQFYYDMRDDRVFVDGMEMMPRNESSQTYCVAA